jgi:hypothetical protein
MAMKSSISANTLMKKNTANDGYIVYIYNLSGSFISLGLEFSIIAEFTVRAIFTILPGSVSKCTISLLHPHRN